MKDTEGFDILVNNIPRTFRDRREDAYAAARVIKRKHPRDVVEIRPSSGGDKQLMLEDGRLA